MGVSVFQGSVRGLRGLVLALAALLTGCAHYQLPISKLETPETRGAGGKLGRIELVGIQTGTDLVESPGWTVPELPGEKSEPVAWSAYSPLFGFVYSWDEKLDVGVRFQPQAPLSFRFKYQFEGEPESTATVGNFSAAVLAAPGFLLGSDDGKTTTYFSGDLAFLAGYRLTERHLLSGLAFVTYGSLSGLTQSAAQTSGPSGVSVSALHYGAGVGYQYLWKTFFLRGEVTYALGNVGETEVRTFAFGAMMGFGI